MNEDHKKSFLLSDDIYLLNHSVGRPPANAQQVWSERFFAPWQHRGEEVWPCWLDACCFSES